MRKKLLALLLAAGLALSLLAGCGSGKSVAQALLKLLEGKYQNVSMEMDPELEADLRQVLSENENDDLAAIRAALETVVGSTVTFRYLGEGQQGDTAFDLVFYAGTDIDKASQAAYSQWSSTFSTLPDDGKYTAALAMVQAENGCFALVKATVDKAGTVDKPEPEPDPEPEPEPEKGYTETTDGSGTITAVTVKTEDGLQELFADNPTSDFADITITLEKDTAYTVDTTDGPLAETFKGELQGNGATVTIKGGTQGLFKLISENGQVLNVDIDVTDNINGVGPIGAVAGTNNGEISGCNVTINSGSKIDANSAFTGGIVGRNIKTISDCTVTINGTISGTGDVGGVAGLNELNNTIIENCHVTGNGTIQGSNSNTDNDVGGIVGSNNNAGKIIGCSATVKVDAQDGQKAGGIVGRNNSNCEITACFSTGAVTGGSYTGGVVGWNDRGTVTACYHAGTVSGTGDVGGVVGANGMPSFTSYVNNCYWSGMVNNNSNGNGIGTDYTGNYFNENASEYNKYFGSHDNMVGSEEVWNALVAAMEANGYTLEGSYPTPIGLTPKN